MKPWEKYSQQGKPWESFSTEEQGMFSRALDNTPESAMKFVDDISYAVRHPVETAKNVVQLGTGILQSLPEEVLKPFPGMHLTINNVKQLPGAQQREDIARQVGEHYVNRYGSLDKAKETFATDPVGFIADASAVATGGGTAMVKSGVKAGNIVNKVGRAIDPLSVVAKTGGAAVNAAGRGMAHLTGMSTGAGVAPIRQAYAAGRRGGQVKELFADNMRGNVDPRTVVSQAKTALTRMRDDKSSQYRQGIADVAASQRAVDFSKIEKAYIDVLNDYTTKTNNGVYFNGSKELFAKFEEMGDLIKQWKNDPELHTAANVDNLKQAIDRLYKPGAEGVPVTRVRNVIKQQIVDQVPEYKKIMADYENQTEAINSISSEMSLGSPNPATAQRKLLSATRSGVDTNYNDRMRIVNELDPDLMPALSGQSLSEWTPHGIQRAVGGAQLGGAAYTVGAGGNPVLFIPGLIGQSPRAMGELAMWAGSARRNARGIKKPIKGTFDALRYLRPVNASQ